MASTGAPGCHSNDGKKSARGCGLLHAVIYSRVVRLVQDYDLEGKYLRTWVPELANVSSQRVHEPWLMSREEQEQAGCRIGVRTAMTLSGAGCLEHAGERLVVGRAACGAGAGALVSVARQNEPWVLLCEEVGSVTVQLRLHFCESRPAAA